jgi:2-polyprenyl-3-methyl-5-hydroxy-6-metoxy-1,4-benzoquinol methylase
VPTGDHGPKRRDRDELARVQQGNAAWWEATPMTYDWGLMARDAMSPSKWFDDQDERFKRASAHFATESIPFDRLIPFDDLKGREVLEIGIGSGFHAELLARCGAHVTGIDLTEAAIELTRRRFGIKGLTGTFERWDAEQRRTDFKHRFDFVWSWGVIHHSSRTARIVRNVADWLTRGGTFAGMVYHRDSLPAILALVGHGVVRGRLWTRTSDEILWASTDGFSARFYSADQWRDLLLGFFDTAEVDVTGQVSDVIPIPRRFREPLAQRISARWRDQRLTRFGSFVTFRAFDPMQTTN